MRINIHWGEFVGSANRTEVDANVHNETTAALYKYNINLRGYVPFALFRNIETNKWLAAEKIYPSISKEVIFYTEKIVDEYEDKYQF